jgi:hypothetical protein
MPPNWVCFGLQCQDDSFSPTENGIEEIPTESHLNRARDWTKLESVSIMSCWDQIPQKKAAANWISFIKFQNPRKHSPLLPRRYKPPRAPRTRRRVREDHATAIEARNTAGAPPSWARTTTKARGRPAASVRPFSVVATIWGSPRWDPHRLLIILILVPMQ